MATVPSVQSVSDTARWVALYRAMESERPDALFRDPFARQLAGERGEAILRELRFAHRGAWAIIVRTAVLDELILREVQAGVDCVLNLAAGLDTRPYRLDLPPELRWVEVDFPPMLAAKAELLAGQTPRCRLERRPCDLSDVDARRALFAEVGAASSRLLVVTEGLLVYLAPDAVRALARDLRALPHFDGWLFDNVGPEVLFVMRRSWGRALQKAEMKFATSDPAAFFGPEGLRVAEYRPTVTEAQRLRREPVPDVVLRLAWRLWPSFVKDYVSRLGGHVLLRAKL